MGEWEELALTNPSAPYTNRFKFYANKSLHLVYLQAIFSVSSMAENYIDVDLPVGYFSVSSAVNLLVGNCRLKADGKECYSFNASSMLTSANKLRILVGTYVDQAFASQSGSITGLNMYMMGTAYVPPENWI